MQNKKHDTLRKILIDAKCPEYGDVIIDEICKLFDYPDTCKVVEDRLEYLPTANCARNGSVTAKLRNCKACRIILRRTMWNCSKRPEYQNMNSQTTQIRRDIVKMRAEEAKMQQLIGDQMQDMIQLGSNIREKQSELNKLARRAGGGKK